MRFKGKTVIVTGAASGIGHACTVRFASEGAVIVAADINVAAADVMAQELEELGAAKALATRCDVSSEADVMATCDLAVAGNGGIDVIVNAAGMMIYKPIADLTSEDWLRLFGVNFMGAAIFAREGLRRMRPGGSIVNVSSIHAFQTSAHVGPYAAAKAALNSLTRTTAIEGAGLGIRANAVMPGAVDTPMLWASPNIKSGIETLQAGDIGRPADIANAVAFLAGADAAFITGSCLTVDGGRLAKL